MKRFCGGSVNRRLGRVLSALMALFAVNLILLVVGCDSTTGSPGKKPKEKVGADSGLGMDAGTGGQGGSSGASGSASSGGSSTRDAGNGGAAGSMDAGTASHAGGSAGQMANADAGTGGGASDAGGADVSVQPVTLVDPVQGSKGDTTLDGTDADGNGVRDDVDAYIATLETDPTKVTALVSFARESTQMMLLGGAPSVAKRAAVAQALRVGRTIDCLHDLYSNDLATKQAILRSLRNALYDNAMRLTAYNHASTLVSGSLFRAGHGCDFAITGVSP